MTIAAVTFTFFLVSDEREIYYLGVPDANDIPVDELLWVLIRSRFHCFLSSRMKLVLSNAEKELYWLLGQLFCNLAVMVGCGRRNANTARLLRFFDLHE